MADGVKSGVTLVVAQEDAVTHGRTSDCGTTPEPEGSSSKELLVYFGLAGYYGQSLEANLAWLAATADPDDPLIGDEEAFAAASAQLERRTVARLLRQAATTVAVPAPLYARVWAALDARDHLCHGFFTRTHGLRGSEAGRAKLIGELREIAAFLELASRDVARVCVALAKGTRAGVEPPLPPGAAALL